MALNDPRPEVTTRSQAIEWWNTIRNTRLCDGTKDKGYYTDKYFGFNMRMYQYLTGREVELIWEGEHKKSISHE